MSSLYCHHSFHSFCLFLICLAFDPQSFAAGLESVHSPFFVKLSDRIVWIRKCERTAAAHMWSVFLKHPSQILRDVFTYWHTPRQPRSNNVPVALLLSAYIITYSNRGVVKCRMGWIPTAFNSIIFSQLLFPFPSLLRREMSSNAFRNGL